MNGNELLKRYSKEHYFNQKENYKSILTEMKKEEKSPRISILGLVATLFVVAIGTTGIVFASTKLYKNNLVKKIEKIEEEPKTIIERGYTYFTKNSLFFKNENMLYDQETHFYYKALTNYEEYNLYKAEEEVVPDMIKEDFNRNALIIALNNGGTQLYEQDLYISEITADETITHIVFKQNENPKINNVRERLPVMYYAIIDKTILRDNIKLEIEIPRVDLDLVPLSDLPLDYSIEDALKDGCFVVDEGKILSEDKEMFEKYIERTENGEEDSIRIYDRRKYSSRIVTLIKDIKYTKNGYYVCYTRSIDSIPANNENPENQYGLRFPETGQHICKRYCPDGRPMYYSSPDFGYEFRNEEEDWDELIDVHERGNDLYPADADYIMIILQDNN